MEGVTGYIWCNASNSVQIDECIINFYNILYIIIRHKFIAIYTMLNGFKIEKSNNRIQQQADITTDPETTNEVKKIESEIMDRKDLILTSKSNESGPYIIESIDGSKVFLTGHAEYDLYTLDKEYKRDINKGLKIDPPCNYYKDNDPKKGPIYSWHSTATIIYHNWLYYYVYKEEVM